MRSGAKLLWGKSRRGRGGGSGGLCSVCELRARERSGEGAVGVPPRRLAGAWLSLWPHGSVRAPGRGGVQAPAFPEDIWRRGPARVRRMGRVWWMWGPLCRSKPSALCPPGCYPRCPKESPIYNEDLKKCVTRDQCGCYSGDIHYPPGTSVPTERICHSWYLSSRRRGPGEISAHVRTHPHPRTHTGTQCSCTHMWTHGRTHTGTRGRGEVGPPSFCPPCLAPSLPTVGTQAGGSWTQPLG